MTNLHEPLPDDDEQKTAIMTYMEGVRKNQKQSGVEMYTQRLFCVLASCLSAAFLLKALRTHFVRARYRFKIPFTS